MSITSPFDAVTAQDAASLENRPPEVSDMLGFADKHKNLLGRYYDRIRLIPFVPDPFTVYLDQPSDLVRQQGLKVYDKMLLDDMVGSAVVGYVAQVLTDARVQPSGDSRECKAAADCLQAGFDRLSGGLVGSLFDVAFGTAAYGFSVATTPVELCSEGQWAGFVRLKRIRYLEPHFLEPLFEPAHGDLIGWSQLDRTGGEPLFFSADEVLHSVHNARRDPARGQSMLLSAHPHWIAKTLLLQMRNYVAEWTIGKLVLSHDTSAKDAITKKEFYDRASSIISNYLTMSGFSLPAGVKHELISGNTNVNPEVFDSALKFCNQAILRTCSGNWTLTEEPEMGSKALAETQQSLAGARFTVPRERFRGLIQHRIVDRLCRLNGWRPEHWPKFTLAPAVEADRQARVTAYLGAVQAQAISSQPQDEGWLRESFGAPAKKEAEPTVVSTVTADGQPATTEPTAAQASPMAALNGAQIDSARTIIADVASGALPASSARAMLTGFLMIPGDVADGILSPFVKGFQPEAPMAGVKAGELPARPDSGTGAPTVGVEGQAERFASSPRWWERDLSGAEKRVDFRQIDSGLQGIIDAGRERMSLELRKALDAFEHRVQGWIDSERITPGDILRRVASEELSLDGFETALVDAGTEAWKFGGQQAVDELKRAGVPNLDVPSTLRFAAKVSPTNPNSLGNFVGLLKARAFIVRQEYEQEARSRIANTLMNAYNTGSSPTEAKEELKKQFVELKAQKKVAEGTPGHSLPKDSISETTVRTVAADAFGAARGDLYQRNSDFVLGIERNEVLGGHDGDRSHPVSEWVHGIKIRMTDPRWRRFQGAMAFNDRGVAIPLTTLDEPIEWSTEAEIQKALQKVEQLSPRFA